MGSDDPVLRWAIDTVIPLVLLFALHLLLVGHDEPGGGFVAALVVAGALAVDAIAHETDPRRALQRMLPPSESLVAVGLLLVAAVALWPALTSAPLLTASGITIPLGWLGKLKLTIVLAFDIGVFLVVVGFAAAVLDRVREVAR